MMQKFVQMIHVPGALGANLLAVFTAPTGCQLVHVSAVASNDSDALLILGTTSDTDAYLESCVIGDSSVPVEKGRTDFVDDQFPVVADGDVVAVTLDYDGASGTAAQDVTIVLTFVEGGV